MNLIILAVIHSVYIIFVLNYFKTRYNFAHPITYFNNKLLYHPIGMSDVPKSKVCKLGNILSWFLALFILGRAVLFVYNPRFKKILKEISLVGLILAVILSMLNFNVVLYLIPHFIIEIYIQNYFIYNY